jgi:hypothetical protein
MTIQKEPEVGDLIGIFHRAMRDDMPAPIPYRITSVGERRITARQIFPEGKEHHTPRSAHLKPSDILTSFPDLTTARHVCDRAYREWRAREDDIRELEKARRERCLQILREGK